MFKKFFRFYSVLLFFLFFCVSCASIQTVWLSDASKMKKEVQSAKKDAFMLFTGSDWDDVSQKLLEKKIERELFPKYGKQFLFYHIDIVRNEEAMSAKQLKTNYLLFSKYRIGDLPHVVVRSYEGDVYYSDQLQMEQTIDAMMNRIIANKADVQKIKNEIKSASGSSQTRAIDAFFSLIYNADHAVYDDLRMQAIEADSENKSGLIGKFKMIVASLKAEKLVMQKKYLRAADEYIVLLKAEKNQSVSYLKPEERQNVWYQIAYLYALSKKIENEKIIYCLKKAIDASPKSEAVPRLQEIVNGIEKK